MFSCEGVLVIFSLKVLRCPPSPKIRFPNVSEAEKGHLRITRQRIALEPLGVKDVAQLKVWDK